MKHYTFSIYSDNYRVGQKTYSFIASSAKFAFDELLKRFNIDNESEEGEINNDFVIKFALVENIEIKTP